ncbi:MAG: hypothetical protein ACK56I_18090, partial [bacterium]
MPYIMDPRHRLDTLFFFAESDFVCLSPIALGNEWLLIARQNSRRSVMNLFPRHCKQELLALALAVEPPAHRSCGVG